jgi:hypothetical protein
MTDEIKQAYLAFDKDKIIIGLEDKYIVLTNEQFKLLRQKIIDNTL